MSTGPDSPDDEGLAERASGDMETTVVGDRTMEEENRRLHLDVNESSSLSDLSDPSFQPHPLVYQEGQSSGHDQMPNDGDVLLESISPRHSSSQGGGDGDVWGVDERGSGGPHTPQLPVTPDVSDGDEADGNEFGGEKGGTNPDSPRPYTPEGEEGSAEAELTPPSSPQQGNDSEHEVGIEVDGGHSQAGGATGSAVEGGEVEIAGGNNNDEEEEGGGGGELDAVLESDAKKRNVTLFGSDSDDSSESGDEEGGGLEESRASKDGNGKEGSSEPFKNIFDSDDDEDEGEGEKQAGEQEAKKRADPGGDEEGEPRLLRVENAGSDRDEPVEWDFDVMLEKKRSERRRRRRRRDGSIDLTTDADDQIKALVDAMTEAAAEDRKANEDRRPAIRKRKMLQVVRTSLLRADLFEAMIDNGMMSAVSEWLAPLPDKSLPALEVRSTLLKILESYPQIDQSTLKQSGLGKAVMFLFKHPKETRENKSIAARLIREWSKHIFQIQTDFSALTRDERVQRDLAHMPAAKRRRVSVDAEGVPIPGIPRHDSQFSNDDGPIGGDAPTSSSSKTAPSPSKDYVIRPRHAVEGKFRETKGPRSNRLERAQREFRDRNRTGKGNQRAMGVSISGKKID